MSCFSQILGPFLGLCLAIGLVFRSNHDSFFAFPTEPSITIPFSLVPASLFPPIHRFQTYLRIRTDHPSPDYHGAAAFLNRTIASLLPDAEIFQIELVSGKPIVLAKVQGLNESLPALLLNSHTDVVPAEFENWRWGPFAASLAYVGFEWRVYGRGTQDMKSVGMQYIEALSQLRGEGWQPLRNVFISFVPDEEIGGGDGMKALVGDGNGTLWKSLNVGLELDEGLSNSGPGYNVYYGERQLWWLTIEAEALPGHGALSPENSATQRIAQVVERALSFRAAQRGTLGASDFENNNLGSIVGVNLVFMDGGIKSNGSAAGYVMNMIPSSARCGFDIRIPPQVELSDVDGQIESWMACGDGARCPGISYKFTQRIENPVMTDSEHPGVRTFMQGLKEAHPGSDETIALPGVFFASTDSRFVREMGIPSIGFSPMETLPVLLHKHDEYITVSGYLTGIKMYKTILQKMTGIWATPVQAL